MSAVEVEVHALYGLEGTHGGPQRARTPDSDIHRRQLPLAGPTVAFERVEVERPSTSEYPHPEPRYEVVEAAVRRWTASGLPDVGELRVRVAAEDLGGVVEALKDLYDPMVHVLLDGDLLSRCFAAEQRGVALANRALVVSSLHAGSGSRLALDRAELAQVFCKDTDIRFDVQRMSIETPDDLNAAEGNDVHVWAEQTVIASLEPSLRSRGWVETMVALSAAVTAARQATETCLGDVRRLRSEDALSATERLQAMVRIQARHEAAVTTRLDALRLSLGRPHGSYLQSLVSQTKLDLAVSSLTATLRDALRNIEVAARLEERQRAAEAAGAARDVRTVVSVFAVVSILLTILGVAVGIVAIPLPAESRYDQVFSVVAFSILVFLGAALVALVLVRSTATTIADGDHRRRRRVRGAAIGSVGLGSALLVGALVWRSPGVAGGVLAAGSVCLVVGAALVARLFRLSGANPEGS